MMTLLIPISKRFTGRRQGFGARRLTIDDEETGAQDILTFSAYDGAT